MNRQQHRTSPLRSYAELFVGRPGWWPLLRYELLTGLLGSLPGLAGMGLRSRLYRSLMGSMPRGVVIGRGVVLRCPGRIHLGPGVVIGEGVELSARGQDAEIRIGEGAMIGRGCVLHARNGFIEIGEHSSIGPHCHLSSVHQVSLGRFSLLAANCCVGAPDHPIDDPTIPMVQRPAVSRGPLVIEDDVWLGTNVTVLDGVRIGSGAVVGACSLVTRDLPPLAVAVGTPARVRRLRTDAQQTRAQPAENEVLSV